MGNQKPRKQILNEGRKPTKAVEACFVSVP